MKSYASVKIELLDPHNIPPHLDQFDYSRLTAIATCPTWGIIRYGLHKTMPGASRAMALEAGTACHEFFAAHRIHMLGWKQGLRAHADFHGERLFGRERYYNAVSLMNDSKDFDQNRRDFCLDLLYTSGFVDDPGDKRRTLGNLEMTCLVYLRSWEGMDYPVWVSDANQPTHPVGIEIPFAIKMTFFREGDHGNPNPIALQLVYTGKIDGVHLNNQLRPLLIENKTGARLDEAWSKSFYTTHQVTGYLMAVALLLDQPVNDGYAIGAQIPLPKMYEEGINWNYFSREPHHYERWLQWIFDVASIHQHYKDNVLEAPMYTHACNRYFRPCSLIPYCSAPDDERQAILEQMAEEHWSPIAEKASE